MQRRSPWPFPRDAPRWPASASGGTSAGLARAGATASPLPAAPGRPNELRSPHSDEIPSPCAKRGEGQGEGRSTFTFFFFSGSDPTTGALSSRTLTILTRFSSSTTATLGRCLSATHEALGSARVIGTCLATGEAVGIAAARFAGAGHAREGRDAS